MREIKRKPAWLKSNRLGAARTRNMIKVLRVNRLATVCENAKCPNQGECFERGTATFMILGEDCTRNCKFCAVNKTQKQLEPPDQGEPLRIAKLAKELNLKHVVITTVTRDDLADGGSSHFVEVIKQIRKYCDSDVSIEVLTSDFQGDLKQVDKILQAAPDVFNHNVETIPRLYSEVRPLADFDRSLNVLKRVHHKSSEIYAKSGFMVGLGESSEEVLSLLLKLRQANVDIITIGQYIQPSGKHYPVEEYVHPNVFEYYHEQAMKMGFLIVESAPLVRSSFHAEKVREFLKKNLIRTNLVIGK